MQRRIERLKALDRSLGRALLTFLPRCSPGKGVRPERVQRVLVIRPGGLGDAVLLVPALQRLKKKHPQARISVLAERRNAGIFALTTVVDEVILYDRPLHLLRTLLRRFDVVVDTEQWHRLSAVIARLIRSECTIGFATNERRKLFSCAVAYAQDVYEAQSFLQLFEPVTGEPSDFSPRFLHVPACAHDRAEALLSSLDGKSFLTLFPGASIPERRWGVEQFAELARKLFAKGVSVVVVGGREDRADGEKIARSAGSLSLAGKTSLVESAAIIDQSSLLVSGDSGILHIGVGLGKPTVSLFGPGIAQKWAPRGENHIVINKNLPCSPCTNFGYTPKCPIGARCLSDISVDEVFAAVMTLLKRTQAQKAN